MNTLVQEGTFMVENAILTCEQILCDVCNGHLNLERGPTENGNVFYHERVVSVILSLLRLSPLRISSLELRQSP
jgi:hypothetical protein